MTEPTTDQAGPVVRREVIVATSAERAFAIFTERYGEVKPPDHNLLSAPIASTTFEPWVGGQVFDRATDGSECRFADVRVWEPPRRVVFSWNIGPDWKLVADPDNASEVEVTFTEVEPGSTLVVLEHRQLDRHGPGWREGLYDALGSDNGWVVYLDRLKALGGPVQLGAGCRQGA